MLDLIGSILSFMSTYYFAKMDHRAWYLSLIACATNAYLYGKTGIYGDMVLESIFFAMTLYGLIKWLNNKDIKPTRIKKLTLKQGVPLILGVLMLYVTVYTLLSRYTPSTIPALDSLTSSLALTAQLLMCYKLIITWIFWLISDAFYVFLYAQKGLIWHTLLMTVYTGFAIYGYRQWLKQMPQNEDPQDEVSSEDTSSECLAK